MPKKLSYTLLILSIIISFFLLFSFFIGPLRRTLCKYKNSFKNINSNITIYAQNGTILAKYSGNNIYIKSCDSLTEIHIGNQKFIFSNVGIIIEEN